VIDYRGEEVIEMGSRESVEVVEIDIEALQRFRAKFNVSADADKFEIL
jgi:hypothetical protein